MRAKLEELVPPERTMFFPIDGYEEAYVLPPHGAQPDIDILLYGGMAHERRAELARRLLVRMSDRSIVIGANIFAIDELLARARIVLHVNSVDGCEHVPYAKLMKPLSNNKIVFAESTPELESSDLRELLFTFDLGDLGALFTELARVLDDFPAQQAALDAQDPRALVAERYDFERNVVKLLGLQESAWRAEPSPLHR